MEVHIPQAVQHDQYNEQLAHEMANSDDKYAEFVTPRGEHSSVWEVQVHTVPHTMTVEDAVCAVRKLRKQGINPMTLHQGEDRGWVESSKVSMPR